MEAACILETSVSFYQITQGRNSEDSHLQKSKVQENRILRKTVGLRERLEEIAC
jgi:hypothetical protein